MWIKLDDGFATHPKILAAGAIPALIQVRAICYASQHKTDGFIPDAAIMLLLSGLESLGIDLGRMGEHVGYGCQADEIEWAPKMVEYGLWEVRPGGYYIHDYLDWNMSKTDYELFINKKRKAGKKGMKARWGNGLRIITPAITGDITKPYQTTSTSISSSSISPDGEKIVKKRGLRPISDDDKPTEKHREFAKSLGIDPGPEWGKFKNYCLAHDKRYANFEAAFRNWLANAVTMNGGKRVLQ